MSHVWQEYPELHFFAKKLTGLLARKDSIIHLCLDGRNPKGRRLLGENYKAGREKSGERSVYEGLSSFVHLLHNDRIKIYYNENYESDEIIYTLSKTLDGRKKILSGDKDLLQSLDKDTVIESFKGLITTEESYKYEYADKFFEVEPRKLPIFRAIAGDASDTLRPPVTRFPRKLAAKIVESLDYDGNCPTVEQLNSIANSSDFSDSEKKWVAKLIEAYKPFSTNFDIMKLNVITDDLTHNKYNYAEVELSDFLKSKIEKLNTF
jgi:5'-3' exonuclease